MAHLTLRDQRSGEKTRFFLTGEGRVTVDIVLRALDADVVKLVDSDGVLSVLQAGPDGSSLNTFAPGQVLDIVVMPRQRQTHVPPGNVGNGFRATAFATPQSNLGPLRSLDARYVDDNQLCLSQEYMEELNEDLHVSRRVCDWGEFKLGKLGDPAGDGALVTLVGEPSMCPQEGWDALHTGSEHESHLDMIRSWLSLSPDTGFGWLKDKETSRNVKVVGSYLPLHVRSRNNVVLADRSVRVEAAVLGVSIYKDLSWATVVRSHLEYLCWASTSKVPFLQLHTDMNNGGVFYACNGERNGCSTISFVVMRDMEQVKDALQHFGKNLPKSVGEFDQDQRIRFKSLPRRTVFPYPGTMQPPITDP